MSLQLIQAYFNEIDRPVLYKILQVKDLFDRDESPCMATRVREILDK